MAKETSEKVKFLAWGLGIGIIGLWIIGFNAFGWVTSNTAQAMIDDAILPLSAEICASKFKVDPNFEKHLAALKKEEEKPAEEPKPSEEVVLLSEIRDLLSKES